MLTKLLQTIWPNPQKKPAGKLYIALVAQARNPFFYAQLDVADSVDGRFDLIVLHLALAVERLEALDDTQSAQLRNALMEYAIEDMDRNLREMGVSDTSVSKKMKKLASALNGRFVTYRAAQTHTDWRQALMRNVYRADAEEGLAGLEQLALYAQETRETFAQTEHAAWFNAAPIYGKLPKAKAAA